MNTTATAPLSLSERIGAELFVPANTALDALRAEIARQEPTASADHLFLLAQQVRRISAAAEVYARMEVLTLTDASVNSLREEMEGLFSEAPLGLTPETRSVRVGLSEGISAVGNLLTRYISGE